MCPSPENVVHAMCAPAAMDDPHTESLQAVNCEMTCEGLFLCLCYRKYFQWASSCPLSCHLEFSLLFPSLCYHFLDPTEFLQYYFYSVLVLHQAADFMCYHRVFVQHWEKPIICTFMKIFAKLFASLHLFIHIRTPQPNTVTLKEVKVILFGNLTEKSSDTLTPWTK